MVFEYEKLVNSLKRAYDYIQVNRNYDGQWSDFLTLAGESVYWVSGYVGYALSDYPTSRREDWIKNTQNYLMRHQRQDGGWGYGPGVPSDADSTSWCLLFLSKMTEKNQECMKRGINFLKSHQTPLDGGFKTYAILSQVARFMMINDDISFDRLVFIANVCDWSSHSSFI